jgi:hypothetical protein
LLLVERSRRYKNPGHDSTSRMFDMVLTDITVR